MFGNRKLKLLQIITPFLLSKPFFIALFVYNLWRCKVGAGQDVQERQTTQLADGQLSMFYFWRVWHQLTIFKSSLRYLRNIWPVENYLVACPFSLKYVQSNLSLSKSCTVDNVIIAQIACSGTTLLVAKETHRAKEKVKYHKENCNI